MANERKNYTYDKFKLEHHLDYEVDMLNRTYSFIRNGVVPLGFDEANIKALRNACIESFSVHARSLTEFLFKTSENSAFSFSASYAPPEKPDYYRRINNQVSHIMEGRTEIEADKLQEPDWDKMLIWIDKYLRDFLSKLAPAFDSMNVRDVVQPLVFAHNNTNAVSGAVTSVTISSHSGPSSHPTILTSETEP